MIALYQLSAEGNYKFVAVCVDNASDWIATLAEDISTMNSPCVMRYDLTFDDILPEYTPKPLLITSKDKP